MSKDNLISVRFDDSAMEKIQKLIDHYECELYDKGLDYSLVNRSLVINFAIDKLYNDLIVNKKD